MKAYMLTRWSQPTSSRPESRRCDFHKAEPECVCQAPPEEAKALVRAEKKFRSLDVDGSNYLAGEELLELAQWVWASFHPGGKPLSPKETEAEAEKLLARLDQVRRAGQCAEVVRVCLLLCTES